MARKHIDRLGREFRGEGVGPAFTDLTLTIAASF